MHLDNARSHSPRPALKVRGKLTDRLAYVKNKMTIVLLFYCERQFIAGKSPRIWRARSVFIAGEGTAKKKAMHNDMHGFWEIAEQI